MFTPMSEGKMKCHQFASSPELDSVGGEVEEDKIMLTALNNLLDLKLSKLAVNLSTTKDLAALEARVTALEKLNKSLVEEVKVLKTSEKKMAAKVLNLEYMSSQNNLRFRRLSLGPAYQSRSIVSRFCGEMFGRSSGRWINRARLPANEKSVIANISVDSDVDNVEYVLGRVHSLKKTRFTEHRDLPLEVRRQRFYLTAVRAEVERLTPGIKHRMPLIHDHLMIDGVRYTWEDGELMADRRSDGAEKLKILTGCDFNAFLAGLRRKYLEEKRSDEPAGGEVKHHCTTNTDQPTST